MRKEGSGTSSRSRQNCYYLLFDGGCGYCRLFKSAVKLLDFRRILVPVELGSAASSVILRNMEPDKLFASFHLVDGTAGRGGGTVSGGEAVPGLISLLVGSRAVTRFLLSRRVRDFLGASYGFMSRLTSASRCASNSPRNAGGSLPIP